MLGEDADNLRHITAEKCSLAIIVLRVHVCASRDESARHRRGVVCKNKRCGTIGVATFNICTSGNKRSDHCSVNVLHSLRHIEDRRGQHSAIGMAAQHYTKHTGIARRRSGFDNIAFSSVEIF